jgi:hypothetical protein
MEITDRNTNARLRMAIKQDGSETVYQKEVPVGLEQLKNDNGPNAKITCSYDLSSKSYGTGASVMCSLTLEVAQDEDAIREGFTIARAVCDEEAGRALAEAQDCFQRVTK